MNHTTKLFDKDGFVLSLHTVTSGIKTNSHYSIQYPVNGTPHLIRKIAAVTPYVTTMDEFNVTAKYFNDYVKRATDCYGIRGDAVCANMTISNKFIKVFKEVLESGTIENELKVHANKTKHDHRLLNDVTVGPQGALFYIYNDEPTGVAVSIVFTQPEPWKHYATIYVGHKDEYVDVKRTTPFTRPDIINNAVIEAVTEFLKDKVEQEHMKEMYSEINEYFRVRHAAFLRVIFDLNNNIKL